MTRRLALFTALAATLAFSTPTALARPQEGGQAARVPADALVNVQLNLTITDHGDTGKPIEKTISLLLANRSEGRVRSSGLMMAEGFGEGAASRLTQVTLNADARIVEIAGDRVLAEITVEYSPNDEGGPDEAARRQRGNNLNQSVRVALTSGTRTKLVESSDPLGDRKVSLEATATILR